MSKEPIEQFMNQEELSFKVQGAVPASLYNKVNKHREEKGWTWNELLEAMFRRLLAEAKK